jgi:hypothetical protein
VAAARWPREFGGVLLETERPIAKRFTAAAALDDAAIVRSVRLLAAAFPAK